MENEKTTPKSSVSTGDRQIAALGYFWILCLLPLLKKKSAFAQFHGKQGLVLLIAWFVIWIVSWIPFLGWIAGFVGNIALFVAMYFGARAAWRGEYWELPILGEYAKKIEI